MYSYQKDKMKKVFALSGGSGRIICSLPALQKYYKKHGPNFYIFSESGIEFFVGHKELQDLAYDVQTKGIFENIIKPNELVTVEPYRDHGYYNQQRSIVEAFDFLINETTDHSDLERPKICLSKHEEIQAVDAVGNAKKEHGKNKTVVIQPFGRSSMTNQTEVFDPMSRSLSKKDYLKIVKALRKEYNVIYFGEHTLPEDTETVKMQGSLRQWAAVIEASDYFVGCDSVGQHMAYAFNKPGTVIMGSTFVENVSYKTHFQILNKSPLDIRYFPIRIAEGLEGDLANRYNDTCMDFTDSELSSIIDKIMSDIKKKTKG